MGEEHIGRQQGWRGEWSFQNAALAKCFRIVYGYEHATRAELSNVLGWPKSSFGFSMLKNKENPKDLFGQPNIAWKIEIICYMALDRKGLLTSA